MTDGYLLGIDIGGTFTDMVLLNTRTLQLDVHKCLTTPERPGGRGDAGASHRGSPLSRYRHGIAVDDDHPRHDLDHQ